MKKLNSALLLISKTIAHKGIKKYFKNTSWLFLEQLLRMGSGLLVGVLVAKHLGPFEFGVYSYSVAFVSILAPIAKLGLDMILVRDLVQNPKLSQEYLGTAFWLKIIGAVAAFLTVFLLLKATSDSYTTKTYILIITSALFFQSFEVIDFYFQSKVLAKFVSISKIVQLILSSLARLYLVVIDADLYYFVVVILIDQILLAIFLMISFLAKSKISFYSSFSLCLAKKMLQDGWPMIFSSLAIVFYMRIDQVMINQLLGTKEVGIFSTAVKISEFWYFIPVVIANSIFPAILNSKKIDNEVYYSRLQKFYLAMVWTAIFVAVIFSIAAEFVIDLLFGHAFRGAAEVLQVHLWAGVFVSLGVASGSWYVAENLQRFIFYRTLSGAVLNVILNLYLIPKYGVIGAAYATVISQATASFLLDGVSKYTRIVFFMKLKALCFIDFGYLRRFEKRVGNNE